MTTPNFPSACDQLVKSGALSSQARDKMVENYIEFESCKDAIKAQYKSGWVAILDGQIYADPTEAGLTRQMQNMPGSDYAYAEKLGL